MYVTYISDIHGLKYLSENNFSEIRFYDICSEIRNLYMR